MAIFLHSRQERAPRRKAIWAPITIAALIIFVGLAWLLRPHPIDPLSIAVLPIRNFSGDASKQYLADKTTDALITHLGRIKALHVVSATTSRTFANSQANPSRRSRRRSRSTG